jgi:chromosomal replication initiation ATPase DnaA
MSAAHQLALPFAHQPDYAAEDFLHAACNEEALAWLNRATDWPNHRLALWGEEGVGKTHLLHIWAEREGATLLAGPLLRGLIAPPAATGLALDDADAADEVALFHLINAMAEARRPLLLAGRAAPARWPVRLPDLASRLRATTAVRIAPADDGLLRALLARLLAARQLAVPEVLQDWLLARLPRSQGALREAVARLDRAALAAGGLTRFVAAGVLAEMAALDTNDEFSPALSQPGPALL